MKSYETLRFKRGQSSKQALNIGLSAKISSWLDEMEVKGYNINDDFAIDVNGSVYLGSKLDRNLPSIIKFGRVSGYFYCSDNKWTSLKGSPETIGGSFHCGFNNLTSLEGAPQSIGGAFYCMNNKVQFSVDGVKKVCNVKKVIYII